MIFLSGTDSGAFAEIMKDEVSLQSLPRSEMYQKDYPEYPVADRQDT